MADYQIDEDALLAAVDIIRRCGATAFDLGCVRDNVPIDQAGWYAFAQFKGARITEEHHRGPVEAAEALVRRLLTGAKCVHCGGLIELPGQGAIAYNRALMADGSVWTIDQARAAGVCRWERKGAVWVGGCKPQTGNSPETVRHRGQTKRKRR